MWFCLRNFAKTGEIFVKNAKIHEIIFSNLSLWLTIVFFVCIRKKKPGGVHYHGEIDTDHIRDVRSCYQGKKCTILRLFHHFDAHKKIQGTIALKFFVKITLYVLLYRLQKTAWKNIEFLWR